MDKNRPQVFLDISIDNIETGRIVIELYDDLLPKTTANFYHLCVGDKGIGRDTNKPLHYKNCIFHRVVKGTLAQSGDFSHNCGVGGESIYGGKFADEAFPKRHYRAGMISMANSGPNTNGSQFFLTFARTPAFDSKHVAFGHIKSGLSVLQAIESVATDRQDKPVGEVRIIRCGDYRHIQKIEADLLRQKELKASSKLRSNRSETLKIVNKSGLDASDSSDSDGAETPALPQSSEAKRFKELQKMFKASKEKTRREVQREMRRELSIGTGNTRKQPETKRQTVWRKKAITAEDAARLYEKRQNPKEGDRAFAAYTKLVDKMEEGDEEVDDSLVDCNRIEMYRSAADCPEKVRKLSEEIKEAQDRRKRFSRRRKFNEEKDVSFINRRNEAFNDKVARAFDKYTFEIKSSFERGTAL